MVTGAPEHGTIERPGATLVWEARGAGPVVVCTHAWGGDRNHWVWHAKAWAGSHRVVTWDLRGHGASHATDAPFAMADLIGDLAAVCDAAGAQRAAFAGMSLGAELSLGFAAAHPERVSALVVAGAVGGAWPDDRRARFRALAGRALAEGPAAVAAELAKVLFPPGFIEARPAERRRLQERLDQGSALPLANLAAAALDAASILQELQAVTAPALVLAGEHDAVTPPALGRAVSDALPNGEFAELAGLHHLCLLEDAPGTADRIAAFLAAVR